MKARIRITLKNGVLDPQGKAIEGAVGASASPASRTCARASTSRSSSTESDPAKATVDSSRCARTCSPTRVIENYSYEIG